jgi:hypothetical protein
VARLATQMPGRVPDFGPLTEGPGPNSSPGSLPAPRVACRCSPVGFDRQHWPSLLTSSPGPSQPAPLLFSPFSLADRRAPPVGRVFHLEPDSGSSPSPATARYGLPCRALPQAHTPRSRGRAIKLPPCALGCAHPAATASCFAKPSPHRHLRRRTSVAIAITASSLRCCRESPPELRLGVRNLAGEFPPFSPPSPPSTFSQPPAPHPNPINVFPSSLRFSQAKPESKPWLESCLHDFPDEPPPPAAARTRCRRQRRCPPPQELTAGASAAALQPPTVSRRPI